MSNRFSLSHEANESLAVEHEHVQGVLDGLLLGYEPLVDLKNGDAFLINAFLRMVGTVRVHLKEVFLELS